MGRLGLSEEHCSKSLKVLAKLGTDGNNLGNIQKELLIFLGQSDVPEPFKATIHVVQQKRGSDILLMERFGLVGGSELEVYL